MTHVAADLIILLRAKHSRDIFVDECLIGPRHSARLDAWVMKPAWAPPTSIGYEVKVSRQDFERDTKWTHYLAVCNEFYFVTPAGLVKKDELPDGIGLLHPSKNLSMLFTKKKAKRREVEVDQVIDLMRHVLMCRTEIVEPFFSGRRGRDTREHRTQEWGDWLEGRRKSKKIGHDVARCLSVATRVVHDENYRLKGKIERWGGFAARLRSHGIDPNAGGWSGDSKIDELAGAVPADTAQRFRRIAREMTAAAEFVDELDGRKR